MHRFIQTALLLNIVLFSCDSLAQTQQLKSTDCRVGTIEVETANGIVSVRVDGRTSDLFPRRVNADDLMRIVSATSSADQKFACDDERYSKALYLLSAAKDRRALQPLLELSKASCPFSCERAAGGLQMLGDRRGLPRLLELLRENDACNWSIVSAIAKIGDETAIADLIDTIPAGGAMDTEARFKAIEEITGLSLDGMRDKWGLLFYDNLNEFHKAMHEWWATHKHRQRVRR